MIYLVRHGKTQLNDKSGERFRGPSDAPLTDEGEQQAINAGMFLRQFPIYKLYASPVHRSEQSAALIGQQIGRKAIIKPGAKDWNIGSAMGLLVKELLPFVLFFERNPDLAIPGGEAFGAFGDRWHKFFSEVSTESKDAPGDIAIGTHSRCIALTHALISGRGIGPTDFLKAPNPGGVIRTDGEHEFELVHGTWNQPQPS